MAAANIGTLLTVRYDDGAKWIDEFNFQNCNWLRGEDGVGTSGRDDYEGGHVVYDGRDHTFLNFAYQGATRTRTGDNLESALVLPANQISSGYAQQILEGVELPNGLDTPYQLVVSTCLMNDNFGQVVKVLAKEYWMASTMAYDVDLLELLLTSGVDAFTASIPGMFMTRKRVGHLPSTAAIRSV